MPMNYGSSSYGKKRPADDDDLDALVEAKMQAKPVRPPPNLGPAAPPKPMAPARQNFGGPAPVVPTLPRAPGANATPVKPVAPMPVQGAGPVLTPKPADAGDGDDDLNDLAEARRKAMAAARERQRAEANPERTALAEELDAGAADRQTAAARVAGLGGFGLSGAGVAMGADIGRADQRSKMLALEDLERMQGDEAFQKVQRDAVAFDLEDGEDRDVDGDGMVAGQKVGGLIGDGNPDNNEDADGSSPESTSRQQIRDDLGDGGETWDYSWFDADNGAGSKEEPYKYAEGKKDDLERDSGFVFRPVKVKTGPVSEVTMYVDQDGKYWFFDDKGL